jgi:creatinine amidohydrolase
MLWHEKSWPELDKVDRETPVLIPVAACEQHGHHLPVFVDTIQVTAIAEKVESILPDQMLLTPTMWLGCSHHHKDFPGTISVIPSLFSEIIKSIADSVMRAGFKRIVFLNGHGGNIVPGGQALTELVATRDDADDVYLALATWWILARDSLQPEAHGLETPRITHACEYETSMMLFLRPDLVHMDRVRETKFVLDSPWFNSEYGGKVDVFRRFHRFTEPGNMGKPSAATANKGKSMTEAVATDVVTFLKDLSSWSDLPVLKP